MGYGPPAGRGTTLCLAAMATYLEGRSGRSGGHCLSRHGCARRATAGDEPMESRRVFVEWMGSCVRDGGGMRKVQKFSSLVLASLKPLNVRKPYASTYHSLRPCQASFFTILYRVADYSWRGGGHGRSGGKSCFSGAGLHTLSGRLDPGSLWCMPYD